MADEDRPAYSFGIGPPEAAASFLRDKEDRLSFSFRDVEPEEHAVAFTVAKVGQLDVLRTIREDVQRAIDEGRTLDQFRKDLEPKLRDKGWWGRGKMVDPVTGDERRVQLGSARRLRTIYRANLRSAYAAGQWERIERTRDVLPYLLYGLGPSDRHRPAHQAQAGTVRRADDPWWRWWFPPNGWGCRCHVRQVGEAEAQRRGVEPTVTPALIETTNPRTGEIRRHPPGVDPAWAGNPGLTRRADADRRLHETVEALPPLERRMVVADISRSWRARRLAHGKGDGRVPIAELPQDLQQALGTDSPLVTLHTAIVRKGRKHGLHSAEAYLDLQRVIDHGEVHRRGDGAAVFFLFDGIGFPLVAVLERQAGMREAFLKTLMRPHRVNYIHNEAARLEPAAGGQGAGLAKWLAANPRGTRSTQ